MQHLEGSGTPVLYIGRMVLKVKNLFEPDRSNISRFIFPDFYCNF